MQAIYAPNTVKGPAEEEIFHPKNINERREQ